MKIFFPLLIFKEVLNHHENSHDNVIKRDVLLIEGIFHIQILLSGKMIRSYDIHICVAAFIVKAMKNGVIRDNIIVDTAMNDDDEPAARHHQTMF